LARGGDEEPSLCFAVERLRLLRVWREGEALREALVGALLVARENEVDNTSGRDIRATCDGHAADDRRGDLLILGARYHVAVGDERATKDADADADRQRQRTSNLPRAARGGRGLSQQEPHALALVGRDAQHQRLRDRVLGLRLREGDRS